MIPMHTQPAGLPSGTIGGRRSRRAAGGWRLAHLVLAPHRLAFAAGGVLLLASALGWAAALLLPLAGVALPWVVRPATAQGLWQVLGFLPLFLVGLAFTLAPRWLALPPMPARLLKLPVGLMLGGWALAVPGFHVNSALASLGVAVAAVGLALATGLFGLTLLESRARGRQHAVLVFAGLAIASIAQWAAAVMLALQHDAGVQAATQVALWSGVGLAVATALHRLTPLFSPQAAAGLPGGRSSPLLAALAGVMLLEGPLHAAEVLGDAPLGALAAGLRAALELPVGAALLLLALRWGPRRGRTARLLVMLHIGLAWLGLAILLAGASHALVALGRPSLGAVPVLALAMGFLCSTVLVMATRMARAQSGRPLLADGWTWIGFLALQVAVCARIGAELWPLPASGLGLLAAQFWLAAVGAWVIRHLRWFGHPNRLG